MYCDYDDRGTAGGDGGGGGYSEDQRSMEDPRLLDAAETLGKMKMLEYFVDKCSDRSMEV